MSFADHDQAATIEQAAFRKGLLILGCGDAAIRVSPPLVFREDQAQAALELFEEVVAEVEASASMGLAPDARRSIAPTRSRHDEGHDDARRRAPSWSTTATRWRSRASRT